MQVMGRRQGGGGRGRLRAARSEDFLNRSRAGWLVMVAMMVMVIMVATGHGGLVVMLVIMKCPWQSWLYYGNGSFDSSDESNCDW